MMNVALLIKSNLKKIMRSYPFYIILCLSIFFGFLCVPGANSGYQIFYLGGVRGIYNSAWLGALGAVLPVMLLWLPGFYLLRGQITEDKQLGIGQMIAASSVSKLRYIFGKLVANFSVLLILQLFFTVSLLLMQLMQHESNGFLLTHYLKPLAFVTIPYLFVLAGFTVLFDVVPFLKNSLGNTIIFLIWVTFASISVANPNIYFDLFGMGMILNEMLIGARTLFPNLPYAASFGYYPTAEAPITFVWSGLHFTKAFLLARLVWIAITFVITGLSAIVFNRFRETPKVERFKKGKGTIETENKKLIFRTIELSAVQKQRSTNAISFVMSECRMMLKGFPVWWYLSVAFVMSSTPFITSGESFKWIGLSLLLMMPVWSQMGSREKINGTTELVFSSTSKTTKWLMSWSSGVLISLIMSLGMFARIIMLNEWIYFTPWLVGAIFLPTLALVLGSFTGSRRPFEGIFVALMYFGPINNVWKFDFMGLSSNNATQYAVVTVLLLIVGLIPQLITNQIKIRRLSK